jgi:hypothetical protein
MEGKTVRARTDLRRRLIHAILEAFDQDPHHFQRLMSAKKARAQAKSRANGNGAADKAEKADKGDGSDGEAEPSNGARKSKPPKRQSAPP